MESSAPLASDMGTAWVGPNGTVAADQLAHVNGSANSSAAGQRRLGLPVREVQFPGDSRGRIRRRWMLISDLIALAAAALVFALLYSANWEATAGPPLALMLTAFVLVWTGGSALLGYYHLPERRLDYTMGDDVVPLILISTLASWGSLMAASALSTGIVPIGSWIALWLTAILTVHVARFVMRRMIVNRPWFRQRILMVGTKSDLRSRPPPP